MSLRELLTDRHSRSRRHAILGWYVLVITVMLFAGCATLYQSPIDEALLTNSQSCICNGTTLECSAPNGDSVTEDNSAWCNQESLNNAGVCACTGDTLICNVTVCQTSIHDQTACPFYDTQNVAVMCDAQGTVIEDDVDGVIPSTGQSSKLTFAASPQCSDTSVMPPPPPSGGSQSTSVPSGGQADICANNGGLSYAGDTCVCPGLIDHVTICGDGTKFDNVSTQSCTPNESCAGGGTTGGAVEPEVVCGCGLYGAPSFGLGCSNGVIEECNVSCGCKP
jgi:hypothetical protein